MKLCATYRVKNEGRWIGESLDRVLHVADHVVVLDDHSDDDTVEIARRFGDRVEVHESTFTGFDEARDRTFMTRRAHELGARWVMCLDGDEVLTKKAVTEVKTALRFAVGGVFVFRIAYLWDGVAQERVDGWYGDVRAVRLFSMFDQAFKSTAEISHPTTDHLGNMHSPAIPVGYRGAIRHAVAPIKHYGYMLVEDRERKHAFYNANDTIEGREREGNYDHVVGKPSKWAPGPVELRSFVD